MLYGRRLRGRSGVLSCGLVELPRRALQVMGVRSAQEGRPQRRKNHDERLKLLIENIYDQHKGRYGAPRIQIEWAEQGHHHSVRRMARLIRIPVDQLWNNWETRPKRAGVLKGVRSAQDRE